LRREFQRVHTERCGHGRLLRGLHLYVPAVVDDPSREELIVVGNDWALARELVAESEDVLIQERVCECCVLHNAGSEQGRSGRHAEDASVRGVCSTGLEVAARQIQAAAGVPETGDILL
jgi:hypothetical protein